MMDDGYDGFSFGLKIAWVGGWIDMITLALSYKEYSAILIVGCWAYLSNAGHCFAVLSIRLLANEKFIVRVGKNSNGHLRTA